MATWLATHNGRKYLYYIGWNLGVTVPFRNSIGLAVSQDDGGFKRYAQGPIVDRTAEEPHFVASCCVLPSVDKWRMWYLSCTGWMMRGGKPEHMYHIKYAESVDGIHWQRAGVVAIDYANEHEYAISRPSVVRDNDLWRMWFSCRGSAYRIGYAESHDGITWDRFDAKFGLDVSASGWDSDMVEYPFVFDHGGARYMLYNGNGYGRTGFGLAVLE
jgi:sucrose-6-phosphate hydrolase SacC (GH32 family)